ncbi:triose-phosphate isomerase [Sulfurihydrogenibium azorense]|jgi:triosephosphate isomerase|uniref:Triosephosphate isomerase n=1 Tax=Sulfurihydrogenibium azorense (strain DSM 15241 / OCM 825 / Az-Fu1) TaxID=204536 RepID=C1DWK4_SULAA|nr:triose-phosphate isomerase [Sulfurihydrogenibium azorense]ACN98426.1 triose-phosphate isomerase [Sulfurihydrogenibium azorense Az-Fu1]MDM7273286.1 triose-phosphate isomerase [Sulfurihydrogenibium azorense]
MRYLIAANWKMNKTVAESIDYIEIFKDLVKEVEGVEIMIAPSFTALSSVSILLEKTNISLGAQNMFYVERGAYTGEISPIMLTELNVKYVILGHSERRHIFGEKDELINKKVLTAVEFGLRPILCVGETLEERELGKTMNVVERQIRAGIAGLEREISLIDIAYEPVWAIGTGVNATVEQAQEVHHFIRNLINDISKGNDKDTRILYGGSVNEKNASELIKAPDVEGFLVGTASLDPQKFYKIILSSLEV